MDNKVVQTLARAFTQCGWTAVRFNFRGVGRQRGKHDGGVGEASDLLQVVQAVAPQGPIALAGFSFGAFVTCGAIAQLWAQRAVDKIVLVGTAASRFDVQPLPLEAHDRALVHPRRAGRHRVSGLGDGLGAATVAACYGCTRCWALLSRTIAASEKSGGAPPLFLNPPE
jgi:alpha-beta hydrolase superfamily lysophospholipase